MKVHAVFLGVLCFSSPFSAQAAIYKCTGEGAVTYQDRPCKPGQTAVVLADVAAQPTNETDRAAAGQESLLASQPGGLAVGMTDTEVLNLRGWGRPHKITRSRAKRAWLEQWTYLSPANGARQLQFTNGKLTTVHTDAVMALAPQRLAQLNPQ